MAAMADFCPSTTTHYYRKSLVQVCFVTPAGPVQFGAFRLQGPNGPLLRGRDDIKLQPKALAVLWMLVQQAGEVVPKRTLMDAVWPGADIGEEALTFQIIALRKAFGEDSKNPQYIATAHRVGFRFLAPVSWGDDRAQRAPRHAGFVGRKSELQKLQVAWATAQTGRPQFLFVSGEPGIGKTTLIESFLEATQIDRSKIGMGRCIDSQNPAEAYLPIVEALSQWVRNYPDGSIIDLLRRVAPSWFRQLPELLRPEERMVLDRELVGVQPERVLREFSDFLEALSADTPWILCLEDVHWSDPATVELLSLIASRRRSARVLVLCSLRPVDVIVSGHPIRKVQRALLARGHAEEILLDVLSAPEIADYIHQHWTQSELGPQTEQAIASKSGGHPLFLSQILAFMARFPTDQPPTVEQLEESLPEQLADMVELQLNHLTAAQQLLLEAGCLVGVEFSAAAAATAAQIELEACEEALDRLLESGQFIQSAGLTVWPDGTASSTYRFRHALYVRVLSRRISASRSRRMHKLIAQRAAAAWGPRSHEIASALTVHYEQAGELRAAVRHGIHLARAALQGSATQTVLAQKVRCLALLEKLNPTPEDQVMEFSLRLLAADAVQVQQGYGSQEVLADLERMRALLPLVEDLQIVEHALLMCWANALWSGNVPGAYQVCDETAALAAARNAPQLHCAALAWRAHGFIIAGRQREAHDLAQRALQIAQAESAGPRSAKPFHSLGAALIALGAMQWVLGQPDQAMDNVRLAVEVYQRIGSQVDVANGLCGGVLLVLGHRGDWQALRTAAEETKRLALRNHHADAQLWAERARVLASHHLKPTLESLTHVWDSVEAQIRRGSPLNLAINYCQHAECCLQLDDTDGARSAITGARMLADQFGMVGWMPEILRLEALLLANTPGREAEAEAGLRAALALADARGANSHALRAVISLHELLTRLNRHAEGTTELRRRYEVFTEGFDTADLLEAQRRLQL